MLALDTNTLVYYFKGVGRVSEHLSTAAPREVALPAVVLYEVEVGILRSSQPEKRRQALGLLLQMVRILDFNAAAAGVAATVRTTLELRGEPIGPLDTLIAATALAYSATLVTHNTREFSRVPGLRLVDWY